MLLFRFEILIFAKPSSPQFSTLRNNRWIAHRKAATKKVGSFFSAKRFLLLFDDRQESNPVLASLTKVPKLSFWLSKSVPNIPQLWLRGGASCPGGRGASRAPWRGVAMSAAIEIIGALPHGLVEVVGFWVKFGFLAPLKVETQAELRLDWLSCLGGGWQKGVRGWFWEVFFFSPKLVLPALYIWGMFVYGL